MLSQAAAQVVAHNEITYNKITYNEIKYNEIALLCHCLDSVCLLLETGKKLCAGAREVENGGHVLKDTTSR